MVSKKHAPEIPFTFSSIHSLYTVGICICEKPCTEMGLGQKSTEGCHKSLSLYRNVGGGAFLSSTDDGLIILIQCEVVQWQIKCDNWVSFSRLHCCLSFLLSPAKCDGCILCPGGKVYGKKGSFWTMAEHIRRESCLPCVKSTTKPDQMIVTHVPSQLHVDVSSRWDGFICRPCSD